MASNYDFRNLRDRSSQILYLKMAAVRSFFPQLSLALRSSPRLTSLPIITPPPSLVRHTLQSAFQSSILIPAAARIGLIPSVLQGLWEGILRAVPKKKTSHRKTRSRFMAGKALKDVTALNKCSACGAVKRTHLLCPNCIAGRIIQVHWRNTYESD